MARFDEPDDLVITGTMLASSTDLAASLAQRHDVTELRIRRDLITSGCTCDGVTDPAGQIPLDHLIAWEAAHLDRA